MIEAGCRRLQVAFDAGDLACQANARLDPDTVVGVEVHW